jgi:hypothetical protein
LERGLVGKRGALEPLHLAREWSGDQVVGEIDPGRPRTAPRDEGSPRDELYIGRVRYIDYEEGDIPDDNAFWPLFHKRTPYRFEHEVRLVAWPRLLVDAAQLMRPGAWYEAVGSIAPAGYDVGVDPNVLMEAVVVAPAAPGWLLELVQAICRRYEIDAPVVQSDLDAEPV